MTLPSRGISPIQEKARGSKMKKDMRKSMAPKPSKSSIKVKAKKPVNEMSVGAANAPMDPAMGLRSAGMKKGGMCKGYFKGGKVDGCISKGHTKGKIV